MEHVPQQWLPPYDGTSMRAGSLLSANTLSPSITDSGASTRAGRGLGSVLSGSHRLQGGNYRRAPHSGDFRSLTPGDCDTLCIVGSAARKWRPVRQPGGDTGFRVKVLRVLSFGRSASIHSVGRNALSILCEQNHDLKS